MEGISHEVCSLSSTLKLGKLVAFMMIMVFRLMVKLKVGLPTIPRNVCRLWLRKWCSMVASK